MLPDLGQLRINSVHRRRFRRTQEVVENQYYTSSENGSDSDTSDTSDTSIDSNETVVPGTPQSNPQPAFVIPNTPNTPPPSNTPPGLFVPNTPPAPPQNDTTSIVVPESPYAIQPSQQPGAEPSVPRVNE